MPRHQTNSAIPTPNIPKQHLCPVFLGRLNVYVHWVREGLIENSQSIILSLRDCSLHDQLSVQSSIYEPGTHNFTLHGTD
jgi:hypothetical protein